MSSSREGTSSPATNEGHSPPSPPDSGDASGGDGGSSTAPPPGNTPPSSPPPSPPQSAPPPSPPVSPPLSPKAPPPSSSPPPPATTPTTSPPPSPSPPHSPPPSSPPPPATSLDVPPPTPTQSTSPSPPPPAATSSSPPPPAPAVFISPPVSPGSPPSPPVSLSPPAAFVPPPSPASTNSSAVPSPPSSYSPPAGHNSSPKSPSSDNSGDSGSSDGGGNNSSKVVVGGVIGGVAILALLGIFFILICKRKKKRLEPYTPYMPPNNFSVKTGGDGFFYGQQPHSMGFSGPPTHSYGSQPTPSPLGDSYGSQRGNGYGGGADSGVIGSSKTFFNYEEVMEMTSGFARQNIIGEGGFGCVYKGFMQDGKLVAVKQLKAGSGQGDREFKAEVEIISRVHHRHLVSLVGYSIYDSQRLLIYEFVPNKTLEHHLHSKGLSVLDWPKRLKIAIGSAKGLAYLHEDCHPKIIHRDIKSANILLDDAFDAQVADFGLARLNDTTQTHVSTRVMGTFGYLAPEYASSGKLTDRSDVFSFGVVLLELITGRKPIDPTQPLGDESLVEWARPLLLQAIETGDFGELVDPRLEKHYVASEILRMIETAAACVRHSAPKRPRMMQVVRALDSEGEMSDLSNGIKYGQSTVYNSGQYNEDIIKFRKMALGSDGGSSEFNMISSEYTSREVSRGPPSSSEYTSGESETRAMNSNERRRLI